jgi:Fe-Mn family superoxide dismutase
MSQLTRRQALQTAAAGVATLTLAPLAVSAGEKSAGYTLPKLPYAYDALTISIDEETMKIHHGKHHAAYVANANKILAKHPKLAAMPVENLLATIRKLDIPPADRTGLINNAGGHSNHSIFWTIMGPRSGEPSGALAKAITARFKSADNFQKQLSDAGMAQFGSGWAWLVVNRKGQLDILKRPNQDSPYMDGMTPILGVDVWEHAYYLRYKNARADYLKAWWKVVNWSEAADRYAAAVKAAKG